MTSRALIVAIEEYPRANGLAGTLAGTREAGAAFRKWLVEKRGVAPGNILCCAEDGFDGKTYGTERADVIQAIVKLVNDGRDQTSELFVFFSGHGFSYPERSQRKPVDVLVASDFREPALSGGACLRLPELQEKLQIAMGPGHHYYFIDACRNLIRENEINPLELGVALGESHLRPECLFTLFSTTVGRRADVKSGFSELLLEGLQGKGRAKEWHRGKMRVTFSRLLGYVRDHLPRQEVDQLVSGGCEGILLELDQPPLSACDVEVLDSEPADAFTLIVRDLVRGLPQSFAFHGARHSVKLAPDDYDIDLELEGDPVMRVRPDEGEPVDLYDRATVSFRSDRGLEGALLGARPRARDVSQPPRLRILGPSTSRLEVVETRTGDVVDFRATFSGDERISLANGGSYRVRLVDRGVEIAAAEVKLLAGDERELDLARGAPGRLHEALLAATNNAADAEVAHFSETLGPMAIRDLSLWLALFGTARIVGRFDDFSHLRDLPLASFDDVAPDSGSVYFLAGGWGDERPRVSVVKPSADGPYWEPAEAVDGIPGLWHLRADRPAGPYVASYAIGDRTPITFVTHVLPNRGTLLTLTEREEAPGSTAEHQYLLPIHHLMDRLPPFVVSNLNDIPPLQFTRLMWLVQSRFDRKLRVEPPDGADRDFWMGSLYGKWLDPVMAVLGAYELLRHGDPDAVLPIVIGNLRAYFEGLPDTEILAALAGESANPPATPPLVSDGFHRWEASGGAPPLPSNRRTYEGIWTSWFGTP